MREIAPFFFLVNRSVLFALQGFLTDSDPGYGWLASNSKSDTDEQKKEE